MSPQPFNDDFLRGTGFPLVISDCHLQETKILLEAPSDVDGTSDAAGSRGEWVYLKWRTQDKATEEKVMSWVHRFANGDRPSLEEVRLWVSTESKGPNWFPGWLEKGTSPVMNALLENTSSGSSGDSDCAASSSRRIPLMATDLVSGPQDSSYLTVPGVPGSPIRR